MIARTFPILLAEAVEPVRDFYASLLGLEPFFDSNRFVNLRAPGNDAAELGVWRRDHELVPEEIRAAPAGVIINVVVEDVDRVYEAAQAAGYPILLELRDDFYGQRRFLTHDPAGTVVDISTPITMSGVSADG